MGEVRVAVLGRLAVTVDGTQLDLSPTNARLLLRLVAANGRAVGVTQLYRDVWRSGAGHPVERRERTFVQKRISQLRSALDPQRPGEASTLIVTDSGATSGYRLQLDSRQVDYWQAADLLEQASAVDGGQTQRWAEQGLALWRGEPFEDVQAEQFGADARQRCRDLRLELRRTLMDSYAKQDMSGAAARVAAEILADAPDDRQAQSVLAHARTRADGAHLTIGRHRFPGNVMVTVVSGDLFAWPEDDLVIGFSDTFDTSTANEIVISSNSAQGQLLHRIYDGDIVRLDEGLRQALGDIPIASTESSQDKPQGKRDRYPMGTVAVLRNGRRAIFCVAYSRLGNNLVARSSVRGLTASLANLWRAVSRYGQFSELTTPLVGLGLSRIREADHEELLTVLVRSFVDAASTEPVCRELRIVITPSQRRTIDADMVGRVMTKVERLFVPEDQPDRAAAGSADQD